MIVSAQQLVRVAKRLTRASGYMELGMTQRALAELDAAGHLGPLQAAADLLRGQVLRLENRDADAAEWMDRAAEKFADPENLAALLALSRCLSKAGDADRATETLARARGVHA